MADDPLRHQDLLSELRSAPGAPDDAAAALWSRLDASIAALPGGGGGEGGGGDLSPGGGEPAVGTGAGGATAGISGGSAAGTTVGLSTAMLGALAGVVLGGAAGSGLTYLSMQATPQARPAASLISEAPTREVEPNAAEAASPTSPELVELEETPPPAPERAAAAPAPRSRPAQPARAQRPRTENGARITEPPVSAQPEPPRARPNQAEHALLRQAQVALARGRPNEAIRALAAHHANHPESGLAEERDALWVQALEGAGRSAEAERARVRFLRSYPQSIFRELVARPTQ